MADGTPTTKGDVIYLVNTMQMSNGRKPDEPTIEDDPETGLPLPAPIPNPDFDANYKVPVLKIVIGDDAPDDSLDPLDYSTASVDGRPKLKMNSATGMPVLTMRPLPPVPTNLSGLPRRNFKLERSGKFGGEVQWLINDKMYDPHDLSITPANGSAEVWTFETGGGWVHPLHLHMEEHRVISRDGDKEHPDDNSREDVIAMDPGEEITIYRKFRTFRGPYVTHCHNLAHEDHAMMFGWKIV
jgi:FtsP/CotA-like multicopper oxidase with cupredoxin domain